MVLERLLLPALPTLTCVAVLLALLEWLVICVNRHYRIGPHIDERSSHSVFTPTCGGIIWSITAIAAAFILGDIHNWSTWIFAGGVTVLGVISVIDDIRTLRPMPRLIIQTAVMALSFKTLIHSDTIDIYLIVLFCGIGMINALNFLDGICGMIGFYGLVVSGSLLYALDTVYIPGMMWLSDVMIYVIVAQIVFTLFNMRDTIFAGDVGAITLGYIQVFIALNIIITTGDATYAIFFAVCIFDTGLTTLRRLFTRGVSILKPHRTNIYQILTGRNRMPHLRVSGTYALIQLTINVTHILIPETCHLAFALGVCTILTATHIVIRLKDNDSAIE